MKNRNLCTLVAAAVSVLVLVAGSVSAQGTTPGTPTSPPGPSSRPATPSTTPGSDPSAVGTPSAPPSTAPGTVIEAQQPGNAPAAPIVVDSEAAEDQAQENALMRYLPWIAAAVAVLAVVAFLAMRNKGGQVIAAGSNVAAPKSDDKKTR